MGVGMGMSKVVKRPLVRLLVFGSKDVSMAMEGLLAEEIACVSLGVGSGMRTFQVCVRVRVVEEKSLLVTTTAAHCPPHSHYSRQDCSPPIRMLTVSMMRRSL